jgi:Mrp family chromosome partitioning ATPase
VVTLECEKTKWEVAQMTVEKIMNAGGSVTGIILNRRKFYVPRAVYNKI